MRSVLVKTLLIIVILLMSISCSTQKKSEQKKVKKEVLQKKKSVPISKKIRKKPTTKPKVTRGKLNIDKIIKKRLGKSWDKKNYWFEEIDNKNGYAKMAFFGEGYDEYFLFVSANKSLLVKSAWGCGPACSQTVYFYTYKNNKVRQARFIDYFKDFADKYSNEMKNCISKDGKIFNGESYKVNQYTGKNPCDIILEFPKFGTNVSVYQASFKDLDKYDGPLKAKLKWNKKASKFIFNKE